APVQEAVVTVVLQAPADAPDRARAVAKDVRGLDPGELSINGPENHFLHLHGALHSSLRIGHGHLLDAHSFHGLRQERSFHDSLSSGQLTYPQQMKARMLDDLLPALYTARHDLKAAAVTSEIGQRAGATPTPAHSTRRRRMNVQRLQSLFVVAILFG